MHSRTSSEGPSPAAGASADPGERNILIYAPSSIGGIAEHSHYQAQELADRGWHVDLLCHRDYLQRAHQPRYRQRRVLLTVSGNSLLAKAARILAIILDRYILAWWILRLRPAVVLLEANSEHYALFWIWPHLLLHRAGVIYLANFHDPVRQRRFGPAWLHRLTLKLSLAQLDGGLVHGPVPPEAGLPARLALIEAPLGYFDDIRLVVPKGDLREELGITPGQRMILAFGHIADRKNLDLLIEAVAQLPDTTLVIAGQVNSKAQRPPEFYRALVERLGVANRILIRAEFIPDARIPDYFRAADIVALTYSATFVSQSGVLQHAVAFRKPVLASCGPGPLRATMEAFPMGALVAPDRVESIVDGLQAMRDAPPVPDELFAAYERTASWPKNIDRLAELVGKISRVRGR